MAELTSDRESSCCSTDAQASCCDRSEKAACCDTAEGGGTCGCSAGRETETEVRERLRERYAAAAVGLDRSGCDCQPLTTSDPGGEPVFGAALYDDLQIEAVAESVLTASLGCGVPTAVADLNEGEAVLDLGSGAGADVLISARRVGPTGMVIGLDMTDEMLDLARANAAAASVKNVEFRRGYIEDIPVPDASIDVVISNCVINLSADKQTALRETARVLRRGGRLAVSDVVADADLDDATRADMERWTGCIAGALTEHAFREALVAAGLVDIEIRPTHRVNEHAQAAIIRARKPG